MTAHLHSPALTAFGIDLSTETIAIGCRCGEPSEGGQPFHGVQLLVRKP